MISCRHCGVDQCEAKFHDCLARDYTDPDYGAVHHLTVSAYMLQHNAYADEMSGPMASFVLNHLDEPPSEQTKRDIRGRTNGAQQVARRGPAPPICPPNGWSLTIADVDVETGDGYRATVRAWAESVARVLAHDTQND